MKVNSKEYKRELRKAKFVAMVAFIASILMVSISTYRGTGGEFLGYFVFFLGVLVLCYINYLEKEHGFVCRFLRYAGYMD